MILRISEGNSFHILVVVKKKTLCMPVFNLPYLVMFVSPVYLEVYNRFWKLFGAMLYFILCMNNATLNVYWSFIVRILQHLKRDSVW